VPIDSCTDSDYVTAVHARLTLHVSNVFYRKPQITAVTRKNSFAQNAPQPLAGLNPDPQGELAALHLTGLRGRS